MSSVSLTVIERRRLQRFAKFPEKPQPLTVYDIGNQRIAHCVNLVCVTWPRNGTELAKWGSDNGKETVENLNQTTT
jgi:hypothetical protein